MGNNNQLGTLIQASFSIEWYSHSNDDLADDENPNPAPDEGWYVTLDGHGYIGPDHFGPGYPTADEALAAVAKWAADRGFSYDRPDITVTVGKRTP